MRTRFALLLLALASIPSAAFAQDLSGFEKVLIPLYGSSGGALGSSFRAWFTIYSEQNMLIYPSSAADAVDGVANVAPGFPVTLPNRAGIGPRVLFIDAPAPFFINAHVLSSDASGAFRDQITSIPVVREREFQSGRSFIPGVPFLYIYDPPDAVQRNAIPLLRHTLRIYDLDAVGGREVRVRMTPEGNPGFTPVRDYVVKLDRRDGDTPGDPYYAQVNVEPYCQPFSTHTPCTSTSVRFQFDPVGEPFRYWPMISVTDNVTQHVAIFRP